jgi:chaperonin GroES
VASKIIPLADRIVVKNIQAEETLASGLVIPDTAKEKPQQGEVVAVGPGRVDDNGKRVPLDVAVGDRIVYAKYSGNDLKLDQVDYLILSEKDILAKIELS